MQYNRDLLTVAVSNQPQSSGIIDQRHVSRSGVPFQRSMNNAVKTDGAKERNTLEARKPQNPEALRAQEHKVTHDKVPETFTILEEEKTTIKFLTELGQGDR